MLNVQISTKHIAQLRPKSGEDQIGYEIMTFNWI